MGKIKEYSIIKCPQNTTDLLYRGEVAKAYSLFVMLFIMFEIKPIQKKIYIYKTDHLTE